VLDVILLGGHGLVEDGKTVVRGELRDVCRPRGTSDGSTNAPTVETVGYYRSSLSGLKTLVNDNSQRDGLEAHPTKMCDGVRREWLRGIYMGHHWKREERHAECAYYFVRTWRCGFQEGFS
jgi:hypothetical protein